MKSDDLFQALNLIGKQLHHTVKAPDVFTEENPLEQIARASNLAMRKVILRGKWWKRAAEPLLAFEKEGKRPVALIPTFTGKYRGINDAKAERLHEYAYCFYPLLPESLAIFRLALRGKGKVFIRIAILTLLAIGIALLPIFAVQWIFNHIFDRGNAAIFWQITWGLVLAAFSSAFFLYLRNRVLLRLDGLFANHLEPALWHRLFQFQVSFLRKIAKSALFSKMRSFEEIRGLVSGYTAQILFSSLFSFLYLGAMLLFSIPYTLLVLPFVIANLWGFIFFLRHHRKIKNHIQGIEARRADFLSQSLANLADVKAAGLEKQIFKFWKKSLHRETILEREIEKSKTQIELTSYYLPIGLLGLILTASILNWHPPSLGNLFAFYLSLLNLCDAIRESTQIAFEMTDQITLVKKTGKILQEPIETGKTFPGKLRGEITFKNVSTQDQIFKNLSFQIEPGEKVAFLGGENLYHLLIGFEAPLSGEILLDQREISELNLQYVRSQIGVVFRTEGLFAGSLHENIDLKRGCSSSAIERALHLSGFQEDLETFPMDLNTLIPTGGTTLSTGQKQRLLIARALASDPTIVILDHALDCIDPLNLDKMMSNLKTLPITQIYIGKNERLLKKYSDRVL